MILIFHGHHDTSTPEGREKERARRIALTAICAMLAKVIAMAVPLITIRLTLSYMGEEVYGLWSAVTSFFAMFAFADLGLGSGLQTELSRVSALDDKVHCRKLVSTTYAILLVVAGILIIAFLIVYPLLDWATIINAESEQATAIVGDVVFAIVIPKILNVPMALIQRTQNAMQEGYKSQLWICSGHLLSLIFVVVVYYLNLGALAMIWASSVIVVVVALLNMIVYFKFQHPEISPSLELFDKALGKNMLSIGINFFVLSIFTSLSLSIDNFIVAKTCSLEDVTPYSVMSKIVCLVSAVTTILSMPLWSANGEAIQRKEYQWVNKTTRKMSLGSVSFAIVASLCIFLLIKPALYILSDNMVSPDYPLLLAMCLMQVIISFTSPYFMVLNAAGIVKFQIITYAIYAAISLPLKFVLGNFFGMIAITWIGTISYVVLLTIPTVFKATLYMRKKIKM